MNGRLQRCDVRVALGATCPDPERERGGEGQRDAGGAGDPATAGTAERGTRGVVHAARPTAHQGHEAVVIGIGAFSPLGRDCSQMKRALLEGRDSISRVTRFDTSRFMGNLASSFDEDVPVDIDAHARSWMDRATLMAVAAYREAIRHAGVDLCALPPERIGVCLGNSHGGLVRTEEVAEYVLRGQWERIRPRLAAATLVSHCASVIKRMSGAAGRVITVSSACASSNSAVGIGADLIRRGEMDLVVAGGSDSVSVAVMAGFNAMRVISRNKMAPFSSPAGVNLGEGAGIVVLKRGDLEVPGCGPALAQVLGYGLSGDAWHATAPDPDGAGCERAAVAALEDCGLTTADIGYVNAHGTGTESNDAAESRALRRLFGATTPISSTKSSFGHTLGASGVLELIASLLLAGDGFVPPGLRMRSVRDGCAGLDHVRNVPREGSPGAIMVNNFGFGGNNSSLIVQAGPGCRPRRRLEPPRLGRPDRVVVTGLGVVSAAGAGVARFREALKTGCGLARRERASGVDAAYCPRLRFTDAALRRFARGAPATRHAVMALDEALGNDRRVHARDHRSGLVGGMAFPAQKATEKYLESVFADPALANAYYFPMTTTNAVASACSLAFGITGYTTTLCGGAAGLAYAADLIRNDRQDRVAAVSADELSTRLAKICRCAGVVSGGSDGRSGRARALGEFAAAFALERASIAMRRGVRPLARLAGWAHFQDPLDVSVARDGGGLRRAIDSALRMAGIAAAQVDLIGLLDRGVAPVRRACRHALDAVFAGELPPVVRPHEVFGVAPSSGAPMTLAAALVSLGRSRDAPRHALAAGCDVIGDGFAFVLECLPR